MGTGNYSHNEGATVTLHPFDGIELENEDGEEDEDLYNILHDEARDDLSQCIMDCLSTAWYFVGDAWRSDDTNCRIIARNAYHEIWTREDSYGHVFVTFGVRENMHDILQFETPPLGLALATYEMRAETFFDKLQGHFPKHTHVATSAWTSIPRTLSSEATRAQAAPA